MAGFVTQKQAEDDFDKIRAAYFTLFGLKVPPAGPVGVAWEGRGDRAVMTGSLSLTLPYDAWKAYIIAAAVAVQVPVRNDEFARQVEKAVGGKVRPSQNMSCDDATGGSRRHESSLASVPVAQNKPIIVMCQTGGTLVRPGIVVHRENVALKTASASQHLSRSDTSRRQPSSAEPGIPGFPRPSTGSMGRLADRSW